MIFNTKYVFLLLCGFFSMHFSYAQLEAHLINGEAWAKGDLVEIGINARGVYGANTFNKPAAFHDNRENDGNNLFGFIANPLADGWVDYDGDFFTPGDPEEGFCLSINGVNYNNNNSYDTFQIPGEVKSVNVISSDCFDDTAQIFWEGNVDGINIKRYHSVTQDGLFIQMSTTIKNISNVVKSDIYFMHNVDPDNNITLSGEYATDMEIISQASSATDNISLVTASQSPLMTPQDMDGSHVSLYSTDELARVTFGGFNNRDAAAIWNGTSYDSTEGDTKELIDSAISIAFKLGDIAPNETKKFTYYYILKEIEESYTPLIVNIFQENPSVCNGADGKIIFSGLTPDESYTISYLDDGLLSPNQTYIANALGDIELTNLDAGTYSNITLSFAGCSTTIDTVFELTDPEPPNYFLTKKDVTNCASLDGEIKIHDLTPYTNYLVSYKLDNTLVGPDEYTADTDGTITFNNLDKGSYTNFILEQYECTTTSNEIIEINGPASPISYTIPNQFYCDEDYDYITSIDLTLLNSYIIGTDTPSNYQITYHESEQDAMDGINLNATSYNSLGLESYTLYAKKTDLSHFCYSYIPFEITINLPPQFEINDTTLCVNSDDTANLDYDLPILTTGLSNTDHDFEWYFEGELIPGENSNELIVDNYGVYAVKAIAIDTQCHFTKQTTVIPSGPPQTLDVTILTDPFSENHTVEIIASGHGDYVYSIDNGPDQASPVFYGISSGFHTFKISDSNGCGVVYVEKMLIDYMPFFTPNNDGYNDYWQIIGVKELTQAEIYIFDRYGKILNKLNPNSHGWDGVLNGKLLPASDYWFKITFMDDDNIQREFKSHFTLKR